MTHTLSENVSRKLHSRAILFVFVGICLCGLSVRAEEDPQQKKRTVTVTVGKYVSVELHHSTSGNQLPSIEMGPLSWKNGVLYVGEEGKEVPATEYDETGVQATADIVVLTNTEATLQVSKKVPLSLGDNTPGPSNPSVIIVPNSDTPDGSIVKVGESTDGLYWCYTVKAPGAILPPNPLRSATLTLTLRLTNWSLATPAGVYSGTLSVSIAAK